MALQPLRAAMPLTSVPEPRSPRVSPHLPDPTWCQASHDHRSSSPGTTFPVSQAAALRRVRSEFQNKVSSMEDSQQEPALCRPIFVFGLRSSFLRLTLVRRGVSTLNETSPGTRRPSM